MADSNEKKCQTLRRMQIDIAVDHVKDSALRKGKSYSDIEIREFWKTGLNNMGTICKEHCGATTGDPYSKDSTCPLVDFIK